MPYKDKKDLQAAQHRSYLRNKVQIIEKRRLSRGIKQVWLQELKSTLKCARCPENHVAVLDFHHRDPNIKELQLSRVANRLWSYEKIRQEITKCEVLCSNCHRKEHHSK